jgi:hypothetical protein
VLQQVLDIYADVDDDDLPVIELPPITVTSLRRGARRFRGDTAVGIDGIRPRHFGRLSDGALQALARLLTLYEEQLRWAEVIREVTEVALGKKTGGARLVGIGASLYRLWARVRFDDVGDAMERRVARPYLPAAPGQGAARAVFDMSLTVEAAAARGQVAATTSYDLKQYYEHISIAEVARGARQFGLPLQVTALLVQLYTGPRRIRVGRAVSAAVYPRRSILAGCTFALLGIRLITIKPVEALMRLIDARIKGWTAACHPMFYVDDGVVATTGDLDAVATLHGWISRLVLNWVRAVLHKSVAAHKSSCVVSCKRLRDRLTKDMDALGIKPRLEGEMLGIDFSAGGPLRRRATQKARCRKATARRGKIAWLRKAGGAAARVARMARSPNTHMARTLSGFPPLL